MKKVTISVVMACLIACVTCPAAFAQEEAPIAEFFGGYSLVKLGQTSVNVSAGSENISLTSDGAQGNAGGWGASLALNLSNSIAIKVDTSGQYAKFESFDDSRLSLHNILGGVQYTKRYESVNIFVEGLAGLATRGAKLLGESDSMNGLGMAFGGGVDWKFSESIHWRVAQMNYTYARFSKDVDDVNIKLSYPGFRFQTGILIPLGKK